MGQAHLIVEVSRTHTQIHTR